MLKKNKSIKKMKLRSGNKSRKVKKGGTTQRNSVRVPSSRSSVMRAVSKVPTDSAMPTVYEDENNMTDVSDAVAHSSTRRNPPASNVNKYMSLRKRHNMTVKDDVIKSEFKSQKRNYDIWLEMANKQYTKMQDAKKYRKIVGNCEIDDKELEKEYNKSLSLACQEQYWTNHNLKVLIDFMGELTLWEYLKIKVIEGKPRLDVYDVSNAFYSGSHWYSRKANEKKSFDPYDKYQILGSNQFCQTYAMMYIYDKLPEKIVDKEKQFTKYYEYTNNALDFIKYIKENHFDGWVKFVNDRLEHLKNTLNESNKKNIEIKNSIKERIYVEHRKKEYDFDNFYDTSNVSYIKQMIDYEKINKNYKIKVEKALNECINHSNICLNAIIDMNLND
jgi:uncharacterized protein YodC (DUF2158 family)